MDSQYTVCQKSIFGSKIQVDENLFIMVILDFDGKMDTFWRKKILDIWIFEPKLVIFKFFCGSILSKNIDFWHKFSNISRFLVTKIHALFLILAQKFKLLVLCDFEQILFLD